MILTVWPADYFALKSIVVLVCTYGVCILYVPLELILENQIALTACSLFYNLFPFKKCDYVCVCVR